MTKFSRGRTRITTEEVEMEELYPAERVRSRSFVPGIGFGTSMIIFLTLLTIVAVYMQTPPGAVSSDASALMFSSGRAMKRLEVTNRKPHPVGSRKASCLRSHYLAPGLELAARRDSGLAVDAEPRGMI